MKNTINIDGETNWKSNNISYLITDSNNVLRIKIIYYYGKQRQYAIEGKKVSDKQNYQKHFKELLKEIIAEKKNVTPLHGCTHYLN